MAETWRGIYPITSFVLRALEGRDPASDSHREQVLRRAAGFWAAAAAGRLVDYLGPEPRRALAEARRAFVALGALHAASLLRATMDTLSEGGPAVRTRAVLARLDDRLARTDDNIDELIARYAGSESQQVLIATAP